MQLKTRRMLSDKPIAFTVCTCLKLWAQCLYIIVRQVGVMQLSTVLTISLIFQRKWYSSIQLFSLGEIRETVTLIQPSSNRVLKQSGGEHKQAVGGRYASG
jgi:hypothetical protein